MLHDDYDNDGLSDNAEIDWQSPLIINGKLPTLEQCIAYAGNYGKITYVEQGLKRLQSLPEKVYSKLLSINILPLRSDPLSADGDGISDSDEYEVMFVNELNATSNDNSNKALYQNSIINMYGFKTNITNVMRKRGNINPAYSLASEKNITTKGNKNYGYLGSYNDVFFLEAFCERDSEGKVKANELRINANLRFYEDELQLISSIDSDGNKIYATDTVTKAEIIRAVEDEWRMEIKGDLYDFFGMDVNVTTIIHEFGENYKPQKYSKIHLKDESKNPTTSLLTFDEIKNVKVYNQKPQRY